MLSIVIPAHNEEALLPRTLRAAVRSGEACGEPFEVVVADDSSTDRTAEVSAAHGARVVRVEHRKISATRNSGARAATGSLLVFVDADTEVPAETLIAAVAAMKRGCVGGGCTTRFDPPIPAYARVLLPVCVAALRLARVAAGCFLFCTRSAFEAAGGFDESLFASEEVAMSQALKRHGRFVVLREHVVTSGRKLRTHTWQELLGTLGRAVVGRGRILGSREELDVWYGARRPDPAGPPEARS